MPAPAYTLRPQQLDSNLACAHQQRRQHQGTCSQLPAHRQRAVYQRVQPPDARACLKSNPQCMQSNLARAHQQRQQHQGARRSLQNMAHQPALAAGCELLNKQVDCMATLTRALYAGLFQLPLYIANINVLGAHTGLLRGERGGPRQVGEPVEAAGERAVGGRVGQRAVQAPEHRDGGQRRQAACAQLHSLTSTSIEHTRMVASVGRQLARSCSDQ